MSTHVLAHHNGLRPHILRGLLFSCLCVLCPAGETSTPAPAAETIRLLPELSLPAAWKIKSADADTSLTAAADGQLALRCSSAPGTTQILRLASAIPVPEWADDFSFDMQAGMNPTLITVSVLVRDAAGRDFEFGVKPPFANSYHGAMNKFYTGQYKGRTARCSLPALANDYPDARKTVTPATGPRPQRPFTITGLKVAGAREKHHPAQPVLLRFTGFAFTALNYRNATLAYNLNGYEGFGERDGLPHVTLADLSDQPGRYEIRWALRDKYEGVPVLEGSLNVEVTQEEPGRASAEQLARRLDFPVEEEGTYWIGVRARITQSNAKTPILVEKDFRLYIGKGKPALARSPLKESTLPGIFCAAPNGSRILPAATPALPLYLRLAQPAAPEEDVVLQTTVRTNNLGTERGTFRFSTREGTIAFNGEKAVVEIPLAGLPPGAYRLEAELRQGTVLIDRSPVLFGILPGEKTTPPATAPAGDWKAQMAQNRAYFHISPMIHSLTKNRADKTRWDFFANIMPQIPVISKDFEYNAPWRVLEPLPGVFDWEEADKVMDLAQAQGLRAIFWPGTSEYPDWLPSDYCRDTQGKQFFDFAYHYFGGRLNFSQSPRLQAAVSGLYRAVVERYRSHPANDGYFLINELPGDAPFMGWIEGHDDLTRTNFRAELQQRYPDLAALNTRWQTAFASWEQVVPPVATGSAAYWHDWLIFRAAGYDEYLRGVVQTIRAHDPLHLIWVYGDFTGVRFKGADLRALGCMLANGGSHDAIHPFDKSRKYLAGLGERTEDHWPGKWTGYFPTVLEASIFSMSFGGGSAMNCKSYLFTWIPGEPEPLKLDQLRRHPYSLDRYEKLLPVWRELRPTRRAPVDVIQLLDIESFFTETKTMNRNGYWNGIWQSVCYRSHTSFGAAEIDTAIASAKLLLLSKDKLNYLSAADIEKIKGYINAGGWVMLLPASGRYCFERPQDDWALLRELGFTPPTEVIPATIPATPVANAQLTIPGGFSVANAWVGGGKSTGETVAATFSARGTTTPAVTLRPLGKGMAVMVWGGEIPLGGEVLLRAVADAAGAQVLLDTNNPRLWTNLLHNEQTGAWYALAHTGQWGKEASGKAAEGVLRCRVPAGKYRVNELITGQDLGERSAEQLANEGLQANVPERDTRIFRLTPAH